jgi:NADPH-dependent glutamate synthase beta subunit-like oxidoreductase
MTASPPWSALSPPWARDRIPERDPGAGRYRALAEEVLTRCRGEGPANCVARCPLGVDVPGYLHLTREGRFEEALRVIRERLPFPGILGYVCTHPCERHCKRLDEDAAVRIRDVKRFLAEWETGEPRHILEREPNRHVPVAVVGAGPAGLLAAHDLRRHGYDVTLLDRGTAIGGCLVGAIPAWRLPPEVVARDLSIVPALGVQFRPEVELGRDVSFKELLTAHCAVVVAVGFAGGAGLLGRPDAPLQVTSRGTPRVDTVTCETAITGVFAAGDAVTGPSTVIDALASGRRAADSVHRYLSGLPLRHDEGAWRPRRLLWSLSISESEREAREHRPNLLQEPPVPLTAEGARDEAGRCLFCHCDVCVRECDFLAEHCRSPRELARRVADGLEGARSMVYSCALCSLCAEVCPERLDIGAMLLEGRRELVRRGKGPLRAHDRVVATYRASMSRALTLAMPEPGRRKSRRLFFPGCTLPALNPRQAVAIYDVLRRHFSGVGVLLQCCGVPADALGMADEAARAREGLLRRAEDIGAEELLVLCPSCVVALQSEPRGPKITSVWEALAGSWEPPRHAEGARLAVHDPCRARHESGLHDAVRTLVHAAGAEIDEVAFGRERTRCCGFGGAMYPVDPELSRRFADRRVAETSRPVVTPCAGCQTALASRGKESIHLWDLLLSPDWRTLAQARPRAGLAGYPNRMRAKLAFKRLRPLGSE